MITRIGFGQVEPNHLGNQSTKQSYAQLPAAEEIEILENGQFAKYNYAGRQVDFKGVGEWMLVWNEIKLYDDWRETTKDFALQKKNFTKGTYKKYGRPEGKDMIVSHYGYNVDPHQMSGQMYPRLLKTEVGDIMTTNCFAVANTDGKIEVDMFEDDEIAEGDFVAPNDNGYLVKVADASGDFVWQVARIWTMPDGQWGAKIQRVK